VQGQQEGSTFEFWKQACLQGKPGASRGLLAVLKGSAADGNSAAMNELGMVYLEGKHADQNREEAIRCFAKASKMGSLAGSANVVTLFLQAPNAPSSPIVDGALDQLEQACRSDADAAVYYLVGQAYESGRGRPLDPQRAITFYNQGCEHGSNESCRSIVRLLTGQTPK
jgi:TPR repeat protein